MLHTLNRAWTKILMRRDHENNLFVYTTDEESQMIIDVIGETLKEIGVTCNFHVIDENGLREDIERHRQKGTDCEIYDDILISHNIHDIMIKDYLGRHCKRKCC